MKKTLFIISLIMMVVCLTSSCQKSLQDRLCQRVERRIKTIQNSEADRFCLIHSGVISGEVHIDTLGIFSKDRLIKFQEFGKDMGLSGRYFEGEWHSFEWKSLDADEFVILKDTIHYHSSGKDFTICDMVIPMSGEGYRIKNITFEAVDVLSSSILFEVETIMNGMVASTSFKRLFPEATELVTAEGWTSLRKTKCGDYIRYEVDWFENGKRVSTHTFKTKIIDWRAKNGWSMPAFAVYGGAIDYRINWYKDGEIVKRFSERITDKKLPISEWENLN